MAQSSGLKKTLILSALCVVGLALASPAADPMTMVPADSLFCVRINNLDGALGQVDMFLTGLFPMGVSMPVKAQLAQFLGSAQPQGVNTSGGFVLFGPLPGGGPDPSRIGLLVPISNYQQFVSGNANVGQPDAQGISQIGPQGAPLMAAVEVGGYALVSTIGNEEALTAMKASGAGSSTLASSLDAAELKRSTDAPVWIYANVQLAGQLFGPMVQAKIQEMKQGMQAMGDQGQATMKQAAANIDASVAVLDTLMKETKYLSLSLSPSLEKIGVSFVLAGVPGSSMAEMFKGDSSGTSNRLLGYMQDGAAVNFAGLMSSPLWRKVNEAYIDLMPKLMGESTSADDVTTLKKTIADAMDAFGGGAMAGSFSVDMNSKPPFQVTYVADLKDPVKYSQVVEQTAKLMTAGSIANLYKEMGMQCTFDLKKNASTHAGVSIDAISFGLKGTDPNSPATQAMNAIYGDGFNIQVATVNNQLVYALGQDAQNGVQKLIDQVKAGGPKQVAGEAQAAMAMIPGADKADFFMTLNVLRLMKLVSAFAPMPMPQADIPTQSSIAVAGDTGNGKMTVDLAVPKQHVQEIMAVVMQMQQQQMQP